jgi:hypothetical protein
MNYSLMHDDINVLGMNINERRNVDKIYDIFDRKHIPIGIKKLGKMRRD